MEVMENCYIPNNSNALHYFGLDFEPLIGTAPSTPPSIMMQLTSAAGMPQTYCSPQAQQGQEQDELEQAASAPGGWSFNPEDEEMLAAASASATSVDIYASSSVTPTDLQDAHVSAHNFFQFSPCSPSNASNSSICKRDLVSCFLQKDSSTADEVSLNLKHEQQQQPTHDMADVLLSLKHAIVHPGQVSPSSAYSPTPPNGCYHHQQLTPSNNSQCHYNASTGPSASLSCTVYPHQLTPLPIEGDSYDNGTQQCSQYFNGFSDASVASPSTLTWSASHTQPIFPGMSVNVSMNMTMHHPGPIHQDVMQHPLQCHSQLQWASLTPNPSPVYQNQGLLSPVGSYTTGTSGATGYSFPNDMKQSTPLDSPGFICGSPCSLKSYNKQFVPYQSPSSPSAVNGVPMKTSKRIRCENSNVKQHVVPASLTPDCDIGKPNLCRICGKTYARPSTLKTHLRTHSGEKPYRCDDCNKSFSQAANLTAHVRTHSGEKPFRCPICDRRFSQSSSVTTHMRTHSGERPYRCRLCKKAFSDSSTLTKHLRIHSGEKPYQCKLCLLRFSQSGNLNRHMRVHSATGTGILAT